MNFCLTGCAGPPGLQAMMTFAPGTEQRSMMLSMKSTGISVTSSSSAPAKRPAPAPLDSDDMSVPRPT